jgi:hypothetical protein
MQARQFVILEQNAESGFSFSGKIDESTTPPGFKHPKVSPGGGRGRVVQLSSTSKNLPGLR